jgi:hypothetical protein
MNYCHKTAKTVMKDRLSSYHCQIGDGSPKVPSIEAQHRSSEQRVPCACAQGTTNRSVAS